MDAANDIAKQISSGEGITQIVDERGFVLDLGFVDAELLGDDLLNSLLYVFHASPPLREWFDQTGEFYQIGRECKRAVGPLETR